MPIRQAVRDLEKRLSGCSAIRGFAIPMEEKGRIAADPAGPAKQCRQMLNMPGSTAVQVLEAWARLINRLI